MIIRLFESADFENVMELLVKTGIELPAEASDFKGLALVAEEDNKVIGCIWALVGMSTQAHVDYFAVDPEYQSLHVGIELLKVMDKLLLRMGVHRFSFHVEKDNVEFMRLVDNPLNKVVQLRDLNFYRRELSRENIQ